MGEGLNGCWMLILCLVEWVLDEVMVVWVKIEWRDMY